MNGQPLGGNYKLRKHDGIWERYMNGRWVSQTVRRVEIPRAKRKDGKKDHPPTFKTVTAWG